MGSPRQTFAGETRSSRQCRWPRASQGWSASQKRYILTFRNSLDPASLLKTKRRRIRTQRSQDCLPSENIYRRQKDPPHPKTCRSVVDLSTTVFQDELFKKLKPSKKEKKTSSLPSLSEEQEVQQSVGFRAQSSQDYLSYPPAHSLRVREEALSNKYEKLVVSRLENLA